MSEETPPAPTETKGRVRAEMWEQARQRHDAGRVRAVEVRASDYYGPGATDQAHYGTRFFRPVLEGGTLRPIGSADQPHALTYLPDVARSLAAAGTTEAAWGKAWLAPTGPAATFRRRAEDVAAAAGTDLPPIRPVPSALLAGMAMISPQMREVRRVSYQFTEPFLVDSSGSEDVLGVEPTPWQEGVEATIAWWRSNPER